MLSISKLFEILSSEKLANTLRGKASELMMRGNPKYHAIGIKVAQKAKEVSPRDQALKKKIGMFVR